MAVSSDGRLLLAASVDHAARLWDNAAGKPLGPALPHEGKVTGAAFAQADRVMVSEDGTAWLSRTLRPVEGDVQKVVLWAEVVTGMELGRDDVVRVLRSGAWQDRRRGALESLGGLAGADVDSVLSAPVTVPGDCRGAG